MIVTENTLYAVTLVTGTWQSELGMVASSVYVLIFYAFEPVNDNADLSDHVIFLSIFLIAYHAANFFSKVIFSMKPYKYTYGRSLAELAILFVMVFLLMNVAKCAYMFRADTGYHSIKNDCFFYFVYL